MTSDSVEVVGKAGTRDADVQARPLSSIVSTVVG
jgi:hypothetical protein